MKAKNERHSWTDSFTLSKTHRYIILLTTAVISLVTLIMQSFTSDKPEQMILQAREAVAKGDYHHAIEILDIVTESNPLNLDAWSAKGKIYYNTGRYGHASSCYTAALDHRPDHPSLLLNRAHALRQQQRYEAALNDINKAIKISPADAELHNLKGLLLLDTYKRQAAVHAFSEAIRLNPLFDRAWHNRAYAYYCVFEDEKAVEDYSKAIELNPDEALYYNNRGLVYFYMNHYSLALDDYGKAIETDPDNAAAYLNRSRLYKIFGHRQAYKKDIQKFKKLREKEEKL